MTELREDTLGDFTGGLNQRRSQVTLAANESPSMLNIEVDPRRGFFTRKGWTRWNADDADTPATWEPRNGFVHYVSDGDFFVYVANDDKVFWFTSAGVATETAVPAIADPHGADFASWGDTVYMACGRNSPAYKAVDGGAPSSVGDAHGNYNPDYTTPAGGRFPEAELCETHAGYMFVASTYEGSDSFLNRIRWSHPNEPEDWAEADFLDIEAGGSRITALLSYQDHLLIFKESGIWALYGYNSDSWQLVRVSITAGAPSPTAVTASESVVYFFSSAPRNGIYAYVGREPIDISDRLRQTMDEIVTADLEDVYLGYVGRRLWCSLPWRAGGVARADSESTVFVFDPAVGEQGAWVTHRPAVGDLTVILSRSDVGARFPLAAIVTSLAAALMRLDFTEDAFDVIEEDLTEEPFTTFYATGWRDGGSPSFRKSWRRAKVVIDQSDVDTTVDIATYHDYNEAGARRTHTVTVEAGAEAFWRETGSLEPGGFEWGDGTLWGAGTASGSKIERFQPAAEGGGGLGVSRAIQLVFSTAAASAGKPWGISAIVLKYTNRRATT